MLTNRRKFLRISVDEKCVVDVDGVNLDCKLTDQSINGAKIAGLDFLVVPFGKRLMLKLEQEEIDAVVRGVTRNEDGELLIGIQRLETVDENEGDHNAMLLNCYICHEGSMMVCIPISVQADGRVKIQLWDGTQFPIAYSALSTMNRTERYETLMSGSNIKIIAGLYGLPTTPMTELVDRIFEFEFGQLSTCNAKKAFALEH